MNTADDGAIFIASAGAQIETSQASECLRRPGERPGAASLPPSLLHAPRTPPASGLDGCGVDGAPDGGVVVVRQSRPPVGARHGVAHQAAALPVAAAAGAAAAAAAAAAAGRGRAAGRVPPVAKRAPPFEPRRKRPRAPLALAPPPVRAAAGRGGPRRARPLAREEAGVQDVIWVDTPDGSVNKV
jgi:hypothetical protein